MVKWINIFVIFFSAIKLIIIKYSGESLKKRDFFSCVFFIELGLAFSVILSFWYPLLNECYEMTNRLFHIDKYLIEQELYMLQFTPNIFFEIKFFVIYFISLIPFLILFKYNIRRGIVLIAYVTIQWVSFFIFFKETRWVLLMLVVIFVVSNIFVPFGEGAYFKPIVYFSYIMDVYGCKKKKGIRWKKIILLGLCCLGFVLAFKWLFPVFSIYLLVLLFFSIVLLIWTNSSKNAVENIIKKIFVYAVFIPFVLLNNNSFKLNIQNIVIVIISIFFSIDRVINLIKDLKKIIEMESNRFLIDEVEDNDKLIKEKIYISNEMSKCLSEKVLIRQILIYWKLGLSETKKLIKIYNEKDYKKESMVIKGIDYFYNLDHNVSMTMNEREKCLEKIFKNTNECIYFLPIAIEYAYVLFNLDKNYKEIKRLLQKFWLFLGDEDRYILYYACIRLGETEQANTIKIEIENFDKIESQMNSNKSYEE